MLCINVVSTSCEYMHAFNLVCARLCARVVLSTQVKRKPAELHFMTSLVPAVVL